MKHDARRAMSRRRFLRAGGGVAIGLPFLPSLLSRAARAQVGGGTIKRLIVMYSSNGFRRSSYWADGAPEPDFGAGVLGPLAPFRDRMLVVKELSSAYHNHDDGHRSTLTGAKDESVSVDQLVAARVGHRTALRSLELGVNNLTGNGTISYAGPGLEVPTISRPRSAFARILTAANPDPAAALRAQTQTRAVLNDVMGEYHSLLPNLSSGERHLLEAHLGMIDDLDQRLADPPPVASCDLPAGPGGDEYDFPTATRLQMDNLLMAIRCDITRVATLMLSRAGSMERFDFLSNPVLDTAHDVAHGVVPDATAKRLRTNRWYAEQFRYLLEGLASIPEEGGDALSHSAVLWVNELGLAGSHQCSNQAVVIAGGCSGALRTGASIALGGRSWGDFLLTLAHAMDQTDLDTFGHHGTRLITELT